MQRSSRLKIGLAALPAVLVLAALSGISQPPIQRSIARAGSSVRATVAHLPFTFEPNRGQADPKIRFTSRGPGYALGLTATETVLWLSHASRASGNETGEKPTMVRMRVAGGNPSPDVQGEERLPGVSHYYLGNDPRKWRTGVPHYARVRYQEVYPSIDLIHYGSGDKLEYDFVVRPGGDPHHIRLEYSGADRIQVEADGDLSIRTAGGEIVQQKPVLYQEGETGRVPVAGRYVVDGSRVNFEVSHYDRTRTLVIDPVLSFSTYFGGSGDDEAYGATLDAGGNLFVVGITNSIDFPQLHPGNGGPSAPAPVRTQNVLPQGPNGGFDAFLSKFNNTGTELLYSAYFGGSEFDIARNIAVDLTGNAYLVGTTASPDYPLQTAYQPVLKGSSDCVITKLNSEGHLSFSTYLGGSAWETGDVSIAVDEAGCPYIAGETASLDFPASKTFSTGPRQPGYSDCFVTKLAASGSTIVYSTLLCGASADYAAGIALDAQQNAYVAGGTLSPDFPLQNALQADHGQWGDAFVSKISPDGDSLVFSTYLGGSGSEAAADIALDSSNQIYLTGTTSSTDFPTENALQPELSRDVTGEGADVFITKLAASGTQLIYSTYLGGSRADLVSALALGPNGEVHVTGSTTSSDFPMWEAFQPTFIGTTEVGDFGALVTASDAFIAKLSPAGSSLEYSSFLAGTSYEEGLALAVRGLNAYVVGYTRSIDFPRVNSLRGTRRGSSDLFIARIAHTPSAPGTLVATPVTRNRVDLLWTDQSPSEEQFEIERRQGAGAFVAIGIVGADVTTYSDGSVSSSTSYTYRVRAVNSVGVSAYAASPLVTTPPDPPPMPAGFSVTVLSQTRLKLDWSDGSLEDSYKLEWQDGGVFVPLTTVGANTTTFTVENLLPNTAYTFRVRAANGSGDSPPSSPVTATTLPNPPTSPSSLQAVVRSKNEVKLTWTDASNNEDGFRLFRKAGEGEYELVQTLGAQQQWWTDPGLQPNTFYSYQIVAFVGGVASAPSNTVTVTTRKETDPPVAPTGLFIDVRSATSVRLQWTDNSGDETGFRVERALLTTGPPNFVTTFEVGADSTQFTDANVPVDGVFVYQVRALNGNRVSESSNRVEFDTLKKGQLKVSLTRVNFGTVKVGRSKTVTVTVSNTSKFRVNGTVSLTGAPNTVTLTGGGSFVLEAKQAKKVTLTFTPTAAGQTAGGGLVVQSTDRQQGKITVPLAGKSK